MEQARANGVEGMTPLTAKQAQSLEPLIPSVAALLSESSGVVDALSYVRSLEAAAREADAFFAYRHELLAVERATSCWRSSGMRADSGLNCATRMAARPSCGAPCW